MDMLEKRWLAVAAAAASIVAVVTAGPARADQFTPQNNAPTIASPAFGLPTGYTSFQPDANESTDYYTYTVTVGDVESLRDLTTVVVCLHHSLHENGVTAGEGDGSCTTTNPQHTVRLTWTRSTNAFSISAGTSTYWRLGTGPKISLAPADLTATTGVFLFRFKVSEAMREGTWTATVTATDTSAATATNSTATATVAAYSSITTRVSQGFGTLAPNTASTATHGPTVRANGATTLSLTGGDFTNGAYTFGLKATGPTSEGPGSGQVTFDCTTGTTFTEPSATRIGTTATTLGTASATGTTEAGITASNTCRLEHGGSRPTSTYSFTVVNVVDNA
jgi:hypothetical protein